MLCKRSISILTLIKKLAQQLLHLQLEASRKRKRKQKSGVNDLFNGGVPQSQQRINANEIVIGSEDLQKFCENEASQA